MKHPSLMKRYETIKTMNMKCHQAYSKISEKSRRPSPSSSTYSSNERTSVLQNGKCCWSATTAGCDKEWIVIKIIYNLNLKYTHEISWPCGPESQKMEGFEKLEFFPPFPARCSGHILHSVAPFQHRFLSTCHTQDLVTALPAYGKFMSNNSHLSHTISGNGTHQFPINFQLSLYQEWLHAVPVAGIARNSTLAIVRTDLQSSQKAAHTWHQSQDDTKWY